MPEAAIALEPISDESMDQGLLSLLDAVEAAISRKARIPVLSLWNRIPDVVQLASHLHLKWPGHQPSIPLTPRIGLFPFLASDLDLLEGSSYLVRQAQAARKSARTKRFSSANCREDFQPPDWEQAIDRRPAKLAHLMLPASSFLSIDRVDAGGVIKAGHRRIIGQLVPRNQLRPRLLVPARCDLTRHLVRAFGDLDLVIVNAQGIRGKRIAQSIRFFLAELPAGVPTIIVGSSPADLTSSHALDSPSTKPVILSSDHISRALTVRPVNHERSILERQFSFAIEGLADKSQTIAQVIVHAQRTWWAIKQSMSADIPFEATAFEALYDDMAARSQGDEIGLLQSAKSLIIQEGNNAQARQERRKAVIDSVINNGEAQTVLVLVRSEIAARDLANALANALDIDAGDLQSLGIRIIDAFSPWPADTMDLCVAAGYFGTGTIDMLFASRATRNVLIADPIEARIAVWDIERRFCGVSDLPQAVVAGLQQFATKLEPHAAPSGDAIHLQTLFGGNSQTKADAIASQASTRAGYVCICFADGSTKQVSAQSRFEVLGRKRLQLTLIAAKDLQMGDQIILVQDDERSAFSERLLRLMDQGRLATARQTRTVWISTLYALRMDSPLSATQLKRRLDARGIQADLTTVRSWLPTGPTDHCGVPDRESVFLALATETGMKLPAATLKEWFGKINRLRIEHRKIGRALARAIRGAYSGRLDPVTIARMERDWGVQTKTLLDAVRVAVVDDVIVLAGGAQ